MAPESCSRLPPTGSGRARSSRRVPRALRFALRSAGPSFPGAARPDAWGTSRPSCGTPRRRPENTGGSCRRPRDHPGWSTASRSSWMRSPVPLSMRLSLKYGLVGAADEFGCALDDVLGRAHIGHVDLVDRSGFDHAAERVGERAGHLQRHERLGDGRAELADVARDTRRHHFALSGERGRHGHLRLSRAGPPTASYTILSGNGSRLPLRPCQAGPVKTIQLRRYTLVDGEYDAFLAWWKEWMPRVRPGGRLRDRVRLRAARDERVRLGGQRRGRRGGIPRPRERLSRLRGRAAAFDGCRSASPSTTCASSTRSPDPTASRSAAERVADHGPCRTLQPRRDLARGRARWRRRPRRSRPGGVRARPAARRPTAGSG